MKLIIIFLFLSLLVFIESDAQYLGSIGRGDIQLVKNAWGLNGEEVKVLYYSGSGRGDVQFIKNGQGLNGEDINVLYYSSSGRGDVQFLRNAQALNGEDVAVVYRGGSGRGDVFTEVTSDFTECAIITFFWSGLVSDAWENPANWNCNQLPGINSNVVIPSGRSQYPTVNSSTEIKSLELKTGSSVIVMPGIIFKVNRQ